MVSAVRADHVDPRKRSNLTIYNVELKILDTQTNKFTVLRSTIPGPALGAICLCGEPKF